MKKLAKNLIVILGKLISIIFFDKKRLKGKWFDGINPELGWQGWLWVIQGLWFQKILGFNRGIKVPIHPTFRLNNLDNLIMDPNELDNLQSPGCYFQNPEATIEIQTETKVGPNVVIITRNHDFNNLDKYTESKNVLIGSNSWIGANSVILPGVVLGQNTIVAAGSVVTKSFDGNCIIAGNPAKMIKTIPNNE